MALFMAPIISKGIGKKCGAILIGILAFSIAPSPVVLRLIGLMPENNDPILYPIILVATIIDIALMITFSILSTAMIADLVEDGEIRTKRRSEGVLFAATTFTRKTVQGFGVLAATAVLTVAQFPKGVAPGQVPDDAVFRLGLYYAPTLFLLERSQLAISTLSGIGHSDVRNRTFFAIQQ